MNVRAALQPRRGSVLVLTAIMLVVFMAFVALSVDFGYIIVAKTQLQRTADAAALAGASQLFDSTLTWGTPSTTTAMNTAMANGRAQAQAFALQNPAGGVAPALDSNPSNDASGDIVFGYYANPSDRTQPMQVTNPSTGPFPNSVRVKVHRDSTRNGSLSLFFARVLGVNSWDLTATATATYQGGVSGFKILTPGTDTCKLLPFALDVNTWNQVVAGNGPDTFSRDRTSGVISAGSDGAHECKLFPLSNGNGSGESGLPPGNFGTLDIGENNNSTADLARQVLYGPNSADLSHYPGGVLQLDPNTHTLQLQGDTGISAGVKDELTSVIGKPRIIPLYSSVSGPGNNATYTIVGFAGVVVTDVNLTGSLSDKHITIQPCLVIEPNSVVSGNASFSTSYIVKSLGLTR